MGKKARIRRYPQKYGKKYASHPYTKAVTKLREVIEEAEADSVVTEQEAAQIKQAKEKLVEAVVTVAAEEVKEVVMTAVEEVKEVAEKVSEAVAEVVAPEPEVKKAAKAPAKTKKKKKSVFAKRKTTPKKATKKTSEG